MASMNLHDRQWPERDGDHGLQAMCDYGADMVNRGEFKELRFDCFNKAEVWFVKDYMGRRYPEIKFVTTRAV
jgi:hypothetical protein